MKSEKSTSNMLKRMDPNHSYMWILVELKWKSLREWQRERVQFVAISKVDTALREPVQIVVCQQLNTTTETCTVKRNKYDFKFS